jgi:hypothetical protein
VALEQARLRGHADTAQLLARLECRFDCAAKPVAELADARIVIFRPPRERTVILAARIEF